MHAAQESGSHVCCQESERRDGRHAGGRGGVFHQIRGRHFQSELKRVELSLEIVTAISAVCSAHY